MSTGYSASIFTALTLCASCRPLPAESLGQTSSEHSREDPPPPASAPDPAALQRSLDAAVGFHVELHAQKTVADKALIARTFVAFVAAGTEFCQFHLPRERAGECVFDGRPGTLPWESREFLGFAVVESGGNGSLEVRHFRVMNPVGVLSLGRAPASEAPGPAWDKWPRLTARYANLGIEHFSVDDVDDDGRVELVVYASYSEVASEAFDEAEDGDDPQPLSVEEATRYPYDAERLLILREDLSLEFDVDLHHRMTELDPGGFIDNDILRVDYTIDRDQVLVHWCEISPLVSALEQQCSLDILCDEPTHRVLIPYDRPTDRYGERQVENLRPVVDRLDERCPIQPASDG